MVWKRVRNTFAVAFCMMGLIALWITQPLVTMPSKAVLPSVSEGNLKADVRTLASTYARRDFAHPSILEEVAALLEARFAVAGGRVNSQRYSVDGADYRNVIARFGPEQGAVTIIGAHYDVAEGSGGADDNASGIAALLELARLLGKQPPNVPVDLVAFALEEPPAFRTPDMGSYRHAAAIAQGKDRPNSVLVLEMIGFFTDAAASQRYPSPLLSLIYPDRGDFIAVVGNLSNAGLVRETKAALSLAGVPTRSINAPVWLPGIDFSDHASYWVHGIPAVMVTDTAFYRNPHYHKPTDVPETLDYKRMAQVVQGVFLTIGTSRED